MKRFTAEIHSTEDDIQLRIQYDETLWTLTPDRTEWDPMPAMYLIAEVITKHYKRFIESTHRKDSTES